MNTGEMRAVEVVMSSKLSEGLLRRRLEKQKIHGGRDIPIHCHRVLDGSPAVVIAKGWESIELPLY